MSLSLAGCGVCGDSVCLCHLQAVVFVVGGGNYIEYQNLVDYLKVITALSLLSGVLNLTHYTIHW